MTKKWAYYNDVDSFACMWMKELIKVGAIAPGEVDGRSIAEVKPDDLRGFSQVHFFAGIGVWSYALRQSGWPDDRECWTGSCPCPSFSVAGRGRGFNDPRHLWPEFYRLVRECRPPVVLGEQVDAAIRKGWLDLVQADLEREGYALGKAVLGACSVGGPHRRQRLYFVAESSRLCDCGHGRAYHHGGSEDCMLCSCTGWVANPAGKGGQPLGGGPLQPGWAPVDADAFRGAYGMADSRCPGGPPRNPGSVGGPDSQESGAGEAAIPSRDGNIPASRLADPQDPHGRGEGGAWDAWRGTEEAGGPIPAVGVAEPGYGEGESRRVIWDSTPVLGPTNGFWARAAWLKCRDGRWRPVPRAAKPNIEPLADGIASDLGLMRLQHHPGHQDQEEEIFIYAPLIAKGKKRVGRLRGYGNAICAPVAEAFIRSYMETTT